MLLWGRFGFTVTLLTLVTLPFDPLLNRPFVVLPLCILCVTVGLISLYICTRAAFFVAHSTVQYLPNQAAKSVGNYRCGVLVSETRRGT